MTSLIWPRSRLQTSTPENEEVPINNNPLRPQLRIGVTYLIKSKTRLGRLAESVGSESIRLCIFWLWLSGCFQALSYCIACIILSWILRINAKTQVEKDGERVGRQIFALLHLKESTLLTTRTHGLFITGSANTACNVRAILRYH